MEIEFEGANKKQQRQSVTTPCPLSTQCMHDGEHAQGSPRLLINTATFLVNSAALPAAGNCFTSYIIRCVHDDKVSFQACAEVSIWLPIATTPSDQFLAATQRAPQIKSFLQIIVPSN